MKKLNVSLTAGRLMQKLTTSLVVTATIAMAGLGCVSALANDEKSGYWSEDFNWLFGVYDEAQVGEIDQLLADFHHYVSYGGDITSEMSLWVDDSSLTLNGNANVGKAAIQAFFLSTGYFHNNWVSLAPEYKTQITVTGDTATFTTQCVAIDLSVTPMVVKSVIQVTGVTVKVHGTWMFKSMNNTTPAPL